jgi:hypothetical protein
VLRLGVLALVIALGLVLQGWLVGFLEQIQLRSKTDMLGARAELAGVFQWGGLLLFGLTAATGVGVVATCRRGLALGVFPPPGLWSLGGVRQLTGPRARNALWVGIALGVLLVVTSAAAGGLAWYMGMVLRACRAGVS